LNPILDEIDKIWGGFLKIGFDGWEWKETGDELDREVDAYLKRMVAHSVTRD